MNITRKGSAGKPHAGQKEHLQTLPCESFEHVYQEDFKKHTGSVSVELVDARQDFLMPASPTFPNDQYSQISYRGVVEKQNRPSLINRNNEQRGVSKQRNLSPNSLNPPPTTLHESRLLRGANQKLTEHINELESENKRLTMMLSTCEKELEKKLREEFKVLNFFESKNSSDRSHVDLYLELMAMKQMYEKQEAAQLAMQTRFQNMERSQKQREHEFEGEVKKFDSVIDQLNNKCQQQKEELKQLQGKLGSYEADLLRKDRQLETNSSQIKDLKEEIERNRHFPKRVRQLEEDCKTKAFQLKEFQNSLTEVEKEYELVNLENEKNKQANRKIEKKLQAANKEKERMARLLEEEKECLNQLKKQNEELESNKIKLNKELLRMGNDLKTLRSESEFQKQIHTERELGELQALRSEIEQLKYRLEKEKTERDRLEGKCSLADQEYSKLENQLNQIVRESNKEIQLARTENDRTRVELEKELIEAKQSLNDLKRKLNDMDLEGRRDSYPTKYSSKNHREDYFFNNQSRIQTLEKYQSNSGHYKSESRLASKLKEILRCLRDTLPKYDSIRMKRPPLGSGMTSPTVVSSEEELESYVNEISVLVGSLVLLEQKESKQNELLRERVEAYEKERENFEQDKTFEIGLKEEAIKKLIQFVPPECTDLVSDYLFVVEEMSTRCTNEHLQDKTELLNQLTQQAYSWRERYRQLEEVDRRFTELKLEHEQLRRLLTVNEGKRCQLAELNKRDVKKKYFEHT